MLAIQIKYCIFSLIWLIQLCAFAYERCSIEIEISCLLLSPEANSLYSTHQFSSFSSLKFYPNSGFFEFMPSLTLLNFIQTAVSKLFSLQYRSLSDAPVTELPEELKALVNLKCLNRVHKLSLYNSKTTDLLLFDATCSANIQLWLSCSDTRK